MFETDAGVPYRVPVCRTDDYAAEGGCVGFLEDRVGGEPVAEVDGGGIALGGNALDACHLE